MCVVGDRVVALIVPIIIVAYLVIITHKPQQKRKQINHNPVCRCKVFSTCDIGEVEFKQE